MTLGEALDAAKGRPTGFDYLRVVLACLVVTIHGIGLPFGNAYRDQVITLPIIHSLNDLVLPMFFALSGFLVAGSAERSRSLVGFVGNRMIRIYPALFVEVVLSAFLLGPIFTRLPLSVYFSDPLFHRYLINMTGHISFFLPGVFTGNPVPGLVNRQLWTVPYELMCYVVMSALIVVGLVRKPSLFVGSVMAFQGAHFAFSAAHGHFHPRQVTHLDGIQLVFSFLAGIAVYLCRYRIPWNATWGAFSAVLSVALFSFGTGDYLGVFTSAYLTAWIGLTNYSKLRILKGADYSYGVYLYGWPVQQALIATGPWARHWIVSVPMALMVSFAFAAFSWHCIEKPALRSKSALKLIEDWWVARRPKSLNTSTQPPDAERELSKVPARPTVR